MLIRPSYATLSLSDFLSNTTEAFVTMSGVYAPLPVIHTTTYIDMLVNKRKFQTFITSILVNNELSVSTGRSKELGVWYETLLSGILKAYNKNFTVALAMIGNEDEIVFEDISEINDPKVHKELKELLGEDYDGIIKTVDGIMVDLYLCSGLKNFIHKATVNNGVFLPIVTRRFIYKTDDSIGNLGTILRTLPEEDCLTLNLMIPSMGVDKNGNDIQEDNITFIDIDHLNSKGITSFFILNTRDNMLVNVIRHNGNFHFTPVLTKILLQDDDYLNQPQLM